MLRKVYFLLVSIAFAYASEAVAATDIITAAHPWADPVHQMMLDATLAGKRIVAVGEHGIVLLSDDSGKTFRQAKSVPVSATLSAVSFADQKRGWAVGQWGVILGTTDGGETWSLERSDTSVDQPLYSVYFSDAGHGVAVGLWSLMLVTDDGGKNWRQVKLPPPPGAEKADRNLFHVFGNRRGTVFVSAEQGLVLRSDDNGSSWVYESTGSKGSLWTGVVAADDSIIVGGLLGHLSRSTDSGHTWTAIDTGSTASITDLAAIGDQIIGVALDGRSFGGRNADARFSTIEATGKTALTAVVIVDGHRPIYFSKDGVVAAQSRSPS
ncbi:Uncharacterized protein SAMN05443245_7266 [Paraburkholderia fungorum]|uniref:Photosynthesis system II assembly factor Ycf48/Hcf136-like domain-containing protein n=1 Tax=Paraburkholderia fungorum TaxID=134537 RepID=A0A1H1JUW4_9BURK|nr:YCF48-related protein [Paraburkholderia fungorum]SDR53778.1 Uncharacterized protein SAMN05443245_7266 [Paraburkholderia fungorum]